MRKFIVEILQRIKKENTPKFCHSYLGKDGYMITIEGESEGGIANFCISRKKGGWVCSSIPVYEMPLTEKCISIISDMAVESL